MDRNKILMILGGAWVSAALLTWLFVSATRGPKKEKMVRIMAARTDLPLGTRIKKTDLRQVEVPQNDLPKGALFQDKEALDRALLYPVSTNEPLTSSKLSTQGGAEGISATIESGKRAISVPINDASGVAGLIQPNSRVDVFFTRPGTMAEAVNTIVLQNVRVLAIGRMTQIGQTMDPRAPKVPVATLVVTPEEAQKLELAKNQGKISLALRNPLDHSQREQVQPVTGDAIDPSLDSRMIKLRRARAMGLKGLPGGKTPNLDDPKVWAELTGESKPKQEKKEPEKPRLVVDVFRGDKHVQEIFR